MVNIEKIIEKNLEEDGNQREIDDDLGVMLWKLESLENFYPCYKSMIRKE